MTTKIAPQVARQQYLLQAGGIGALAIRRVRESISRRLIYSRLRQKFPCDLCNLFQPMEELCDLSLIVIFELQGCFVFLRCFVEVIQ